MNGKIYMRISPTGSRYVGQTVKAEETRWKQHVNFAYNKKLGLYDLPLSRAIRKYGADNFRVEILESGIDTKEKLDERERYWIKEKHSLVNERKGGLNVTIGGSGYVKFTNDDFKKLYEDGLSIYEISQITGAHSATIRSHIGSNISENSRRNRLRVLKLNPPKSISNYDIETCEKIMTFPCAADASLYYCGIREAAYVVGCIYGNCASSLGYFWKYDDQPMDVIYDQYKRYHNPKNNNTRGRPVVNIETGETYKSALFAAKQTGIKRDLIVSCCIGMRENAGGFHWRFENEEQAIYKGTHAKPITCKETGITYPSISEAVRQTKIRAAKITECLKGRRENADGFHFEYKNPSDKDSGKFKNSRFKPVLCVSTGIIYETMEAAAHAAGIGIYRLREHLKKGEYELNGLRWKYAIKRDDAV